MYALKKRPSINHPNEVSYFKSITNTLKSVKRPGTFATGGVCQMPFPGLLVNGVSESVLGLPLGTNEVKGIIDIATRAPYGRGEETIVDTSVRRTWQLNPSQFILKNDEWTISLRGLLDKVARELGCIPERNVSCELYKLLLYEPGAFFKVRYNVPHY